MRTLAPALLLLAALAGACGAPPRPPAAASGGAPVELTVTALDGSTLELSSLRGKVVVVDAWATWCGPCIQALPALEKLSKLRPDEIVVVGLSVDHDRAALAGFLQERPLPYFVAHADREAQRVFRTQALPTIFVLDREGVIRESLVGNHPAAALVQAAERHL